MNTKKKLLLNTLLAAIGSLAAKTLSLSSFPTAFVWLMFLLITITGVGKQHFRLNRPFFMIKFFFLFLWELFLANISVAYIVLTSHKRTVESGFINISTEGLSLPQAITLSHCITLTPGTISVDINKRTREIIVHLLNISDNANATFTIEKKLKHYLIEATS